MTRLRCCATRGLPALGALLLAGLPTLTVQAAQTLYEWHEPNGTAVYSQTPPPRGVSAPIRTLQLKLPPAAPPAADRSEARHDPVTEAQDAANPETGADANPESAQETGATAAAGPSANAGADPAGASAHVAAAWRKLQRAQRDLLAGRVPLPEERQHLVDGHSRLTSDYFARIRALEAAVADARAALRAARAARDLTRAG